MIQVIINCYCYKVGTISNSTVQNLAKNPEIIGHPYKHTTPAMSLLIFGMDSKASARLALCYQLWNPGRLGIPCSAASSM